MLVDVEMLGLHFQMFFHNVGLPRVTCDCTKILNVYNLEHIFKKISLKKEKLGITNINFNQ